MKTRAGVWVLYMILATGIAFLIFAITEQSMRRAVNDPQTQMADEAVTTLSHGAVPASLVSRDVRVDILTSAAPFTMVFDEQGTVLESSMHMGDRLPVPPQGTFAYAKTHTKNSFTWEPQEDVRLAAVLRHYTATSSSGFVLVGRSMYRTEKRIEEVGIFIATCWLISIIGSFIIFFFVKEKVL